MVPKLTPEITSADLIKLGVMVRTGNRTPLYEPLTDAFRNVQWARLLALEANSIVEDIGNAQSPGVQIVYPYGQMKHSIAVTDSIIHTKSALDSMAVFLTGLLGLSASGGDRDFKKQSFRTEIMNKNQSLGTKINQFQQWFADLQEIRDEWLHRSTIRSMLITGPSECGPLPIPKKGLETGLKAFSPPITKTRFFSTKDFLDYHYYNAVKLFGVIMAHCIQVESALVGSPTIDPSAEKELAMFPGLATQNVTITTMRYKSGPYGW